MQDSVFQNHHNSMISYYVHVSGKSCIKGKKQSSCLPLGHQGGYLWELPFRIVMLTKVEYVYRLIEYDIE
jgi:hypothetical protein